MKGRSFCSCLIFFFFMEEFNFNDVSYIIRDFFREENVDAVWNEGAERGEITIRFPRVLITNENDEFIEITNLFVKVEVSKDGKMVSSFKMLRSEFTDAQINSGYSHSHLPSLHWPIAYQIPCVGSGPIRGTMVILYTDPSEDLWSLFCVELMKFVETESIAGTPYAYLNRVRLHSTYPYKSSSYPVIVRGNRETVLIDRFVNYLISERKLDFSYCEGYRIALNENSRIIEISNLFIDWVNSLTNLEYESSRKIISDMFVNAKYVGNRIEVLSDSSVCEREIERHVGEPVVTFKGTPYTLSIIRTQTDDNVLKVLCHNVLRIIESKLLDKVNYEYGFRKTFGNAKKAVRYI